MERIYKQMCIKRLGLRSNVNKGGGVTLGVIKPFIINTNFEMLNTKNHKRIFVFKINVNIKKIRFLDLQYISFSNDFKSFIPFLMCYITL